MIVVAKCDTTLQMSPIYIKCYTNVTKKKEQIRFPWIYIKNKGNNNNENCMHIYEIPIGKVSNLNSGQIQKQI